jgi:ABC-type lipoprotein release transport system permease subunit
MTFKNIARTRVFFTSNIIAISVGIILVVIMLSVSSAIKNYARELVREETSALAIEISVSSQSFGTPPLTRKNLDKLSKHQAISRAIPLIQGVFADLSHQGGNKTTISLWSTIGETDPELTRLQWQHGNNHEITKYNDNYIVIPQRTAEEMGVSRPSELVSKPITLTVIRRKGGREEYESIHLYVAAIARKTRFYRCYAPLSVLEKIRKWQQRKLDQIHIPGTTTLPPSTTETPQTKPMIYESALVYVNTMEDVAPLRRELEKQGYRTVSILDTVKRYEEIAGVLAIILGFIGTISLLTGSVSIFNATYASVFRRIKEIGIFKTYGATKWNILSLILAEISVTALLAGLIGYALGIMFCKIVQDAFLAGTKLDLMQTGWGLFLFVELLALMVCMGAGYWPARKGAKINPIEAIRHE